MKRLILIRGPICAGKSTTVDLLSGILDDCSVVDQDLLKRTIDKKKRSPWRSRIALDTALYLADLLMKEGRDIIADIHSAIPGQYDEYKKLAEKHQYQMFSFLLYPPLDVCLQRNRERVISDVWYQLGDDDIEKYWGKVYRVEGEAVFDTSVVATEDVVSEILRVIGGKE
ncbi:MAG: AAA family ATPase [Candidatus Moraniibacteriota bacterium]